MNGHFACTYICAPHMCNAGGSQKRALDPGNWSCRELWAAMLVLEIKCRAPEDLTALLTTQLQLQYKCIKTWVMTVEHKVVFFSSPLLCSPTRELSTIRWGQRFRYSLERSLLVLSSCLPLRPSLHLSSGGLNYLEAERLSSEMGFPPQSLFT